MASCEAVRRLGKTFLTSTHWVNDAENYVRPVTVTVQSNFSIAMALIEVDGRYTIPGIAEAYEICLQKSVCIAIAGSLYSEVYFKM